MTTCPPSSSSARSQNVEMIRGSWLTMITVWPSERSSRYRCLAARPESRVADREDLVEHQHLAHGLERHRVAEPRRHAARIVLQLQVREALELGERQNLVHAPADLARATAP